MYMKVYLKNNKIKVGHGYNVMVYGRTYMIFHNLEALEKDHETESGVPVKKRDKNKLAITFPSIEM